MSGWNPAVWLWVVLLCDTVSWLSVDKTVVCDHWNESYWAVLSCSTFYDAVPSGSNFIVSRWNPCGRYGRVLREKISVFSVLC